MEFIEQNLDIFAILFGVSFLAIFIAASTNRVTVFKDYGDLWMTLGLILWPSFGLMILAIIQSEETNDILFGSRAATIITILTACATLFSLVKTFTNSIAENGPVLGSIVGVFKVFSSIIIIFSVLGYINRITEDKRSLGSTLIFITIFTIVFKWILDVLVNGHKVKPRLN